MHSGGSAVRTAVESNVPHVNESMSMYITVLELDVVLSPFSRILEPESWFSLCRSVAYQQHSHHKLTSWAEGKLCWSYKSDVVSGNSFDRRKALLQRRSFQGVRSVRFACRWHKVILQRITFVRAMTGFLVHRLALSTILLKTYLRIVQDGKYEQWSLFLLLSD